MGKSTLEDPIGTEAKTVVLVGTTGIGKSATGNSIIGANVFGTFPNSATTCQKQRAVVDDGQILDVIDTPGFNIGSSFGPKIINKCISMAKGGIHAFLVVVSDKTRFSAREASSIESLKQVFGGNIGEYMIVVFTHGDALPKISLDDFLALSCPEPLVKTLEMCGNRHILFDNMTEDEVKKSQQRKELLRLVDAVVDNNGGIPFTPFMNELIAHSLDVSEHGEKAYEEHLRLCIEKFQQRGKSAFHDLKFPIGTEAKTLVLVGRTGTGKSATGNSIIGANVFDSMASLDGVTATCQMQRTVLADGQILNVIDTPGLFDSSIDPKSIGNEISKCINLAKNGIHAVLVVVSLGTHFSDEEASAIQRFRQFFGGKIDDYIILVFTHGHGLGEMPLDIFLEYRCPELLERTLKLCGSRHVLFDNLTEDEVQKSQQLEELLRLVDTVVDNNGGIPYTNELFVDSPGVSDNGLNKAYEEQMNGFLEKIESKLRETALILEKQLAEEQNARMKAENGEKFFEEAYVEHLKLFIHKSEAKLRDRTLGLEKQLADEQVARILAEAKAQEVQTKSNFEINMLRKDLDRSRSEAEELRETLRETEAMLKETKEKFKETEEIFKETEQNFAETKEKFKETEEIFKDMEQNFAEKFKETEKKFKITEEKTENYEVEYNYFMIILGLVF